MIGTEGHSPNIFPTMRVATGLCLLLVAACGRGPEAGRSAQDAALVEEMLEEATRDTTLTAPRLVTGPTLVVFWLAAADTLHPDDAASVVDDMNHYTEQIGPRLEAWGVALLPTNADTVYIALPNDRRRTVLLTGLDFPFGYLIAEPGGIERILPGVLTAEELLEEVRVYFDFEEDTTAAAPPPKVITD